MNLFTLFNSNYINDEENISFPHEHIIDLSDPRAIKQACSRDYVCAKYARNHYMENNFLYSNCIGLNIDNIHSDDPEDWITPNQISLLLPGVCCIVHFQADHMKATDQLSARPRFNLLLPTEETTNPMTQHCLVDRTYNHLLGNFDQPYIGRHTEKFFGTEKPIIGYVCGHMNLTDYNNISDKKQEEK